MSGLADRSRPFRAASNPVASLCPALGCSRRAVQKGKLMLFHVTHTHTETTYPIHNPEVRSKTFARVLPALETAGVRVIGAWGDTLAHQLFFMLDADSIEAIQEGFDPITDQGTATSACRPQASLTQRRTRDTTMRTSGAVGSDTHDLATACRRPTRFNADPK